MKLQLAHVLWFVWNAIPATSSEEPNSKSLLRSSRRLAKTTAKIHTDNDNEEFGNAMDIYALASSFENSRLLQDMSMSMNTGGGGSSKSDGTDTVVVPTSNPVQTPPPAPAPTSNPVQTPPPAPAPTSAPTAQPTDMPVAAAVDDLYYQQDDQQYYEYEEATVPTKNPTVYNQYDDQSNVPTTNPTTNSGTGPAPAPAPAPTGTTPTITAPTNTGASPSTTGASNIPPTPTSTTNVVSPAIDEQSTTTAIDEQSTTTSPNDVGNSDPDSVIGQQNVLISRDTSSKTINMGAVVGLALAGTATLAAAGYVTMRRLQQQPPAPDL